jgi:DNA adenine methylase
MPTSVAHALPTGTSAENLPAPSPFVKWVGGKGKLQHTLGAMLPPGAELMRHVEPFLGGGAFFYARQPERALLCDINKDLILTYKAVRDELPAVVRHLGQFAHRHDKAHYYATRTRYNAQSHRSDAERAAMFIYMNKTCFNGLHRVNRRGEYNVPIGSYKNPRILNVEGLYAASMQLQNADIECTPFESLLSHVKPGDFVYLDPPYEPVSRTANFTGYAVNGFSQEDQVRLRDVVRDLDRRGARIMLSNSDVPFIRELYRGFQIDQIMAPRAISCVGSKRQSVPEVVVRNY